MTYTAQHMAGDTFAIWDHCNNTIADKVTGAIAATERARNLDFRRYPGLSDYISIALEDLQFSEEDQSCEEERQPFDSGTIYSLFHLTYKQMRDNWIQFARDCADYIAAATDYNPGNNEYAHQSVTIQRIGGTYWLAQTGTGVTFTDDGDAPCLQAMADYARAHSVEGLYFGDDEKVHLI